MADSAATQNLLLVILRAGTFDLDLLTHASGKPRKRVVIALGKLIRRGFVDQVKPKAALTHDANGRIVKNETPCPIYGLTRAGAEFARSGQRITSGPKGPHAGQRRTLKETFRSRLWRAFRMRGKASIPELIEIASRDEISAEDNAQKYMRRLVRAGVAIVLPVKAKGFAPTSNGFRRYALTVDLGPLAPIATRAHLFDPNRGQKIPYTVKRK